MAFASKKDIEQAFRLAETTAHFRVDEVRPVAIAKDIRVPVLLIHGQNDHETSPTHSQSVFAALRGPKRLILVPGAGHHDALRADVWNTVDAWLDGVVPSRAD